MLLSLYINNKAGGLIYHRVRTASASHAGAHSWPTLTSPGAICSAGFCRALREAGRE